MKSPFLAFTLSFFLPGTGLWYLGRWTGGFVNLAIVLVIGILGALALSDEVFRQYSRYLAIACGGGSGGLALALAQHMNQRKPTRGDVAPGKGIADPGAPADRPRQ
jgi:hypothetical protein